MTRRNAGELDAKIDALCRAEILAAIRAERTYTAAAKRLGLTRTRFYRLCARCWPSIEDRLTERMLPRRLRPAQEPAVANA